LLPLAPFVRHGPPQRDKGAVALEGVKDAGAFP
jgi:hypothetical protein